MVRCEYCGQLYEGLSCPHCCAPRGEPEPVERSSAFSDDYPDEWILTNSSCVGNNNVQVIGDNNVVNGWVYADDMLYYVDHDVWPEDQPSERQEIVDATAQAKKHGRRLRWTVINLISVWLGTFSLGVLTGNSIGWSIGVATVFCVVIGCCLATGYKE